MPIEKWDQPVRRPAPPRPTVVSRARPDGPVLFEDAVEAMIERSGWGANTRTKARDILLGGRLAQFRLDHGVETIDQLTDDLVADFYAGCRRAGISPSYLIKIRANLLALQRFCHRTPGYHGRLTATELLPMPRVPTREAPSLSPADELRVLRACVTERDRLMLEVMLTTGIRVGELVALRLEDLRLDDRPPHIVVRRSAGEQTTKNATDRVVPLTWAGGTLARRLGDYVEKRRPASHRLEVFLSLRRDRFGGHPAVTAQAVGAMLDRVGAKLGLHLHPHLLRHTWATRAVRAGIPMPILQEAGGWASLAMVSRYYTADRRAMLEAFARAHRGS